MWVSTEREQLTLSWVILISKAPNNKELIHILGIFIHIWFGLYLHASAIKL